MAVPFSSTHLRVPRGFGIILEGLTREVLRDQPKDIPSYAALYFDGLLKERAESGMDPAEWAAKLEDRFYNNNTTTTTTTTFKASPTRMATEMTSSTEEKSSRSQTKDDMSYRVSSPSTAKPDGISDVCDSDNEGEEETVSTEVEMKKQNQEELDSRLPVTGVSSNDGGREEEDADQRPITTSHQAGGEFRGSDINPSTIKDVSRSGFEHAPSSRSDPTRDACPEELGMIEHNEEPAIQNQETTNVDNEVKYSEINQSSDTENQETTNVDDEVKYSEINQSSDTENQETTKIDDEVKYSEINQSSDTENQETTNVDNEVKYSEINQSSDTENQETTNVDDEVKYSEINQSSDTENQETTNVDNEVKYSEINQSSDTENQETTNVDDEVKYSEINQSSDTENQETTNVDEVKYSEINQSSDTENPETTNVDDEVKYSEINQSSDTENQETTNVDDGVKYSEINQSSDTENQETTNVDDEVKYSEINQSSDTENKETTNVDDEVKCSEINQSSDTENQETTNVDNEVKYSEINQSSDTENQETTNVDDEVKYSEINQSSDTENKETTNVDDEVKYSEINQSSDTENQETTNVDDEVKYSEINQSSDTENILEEFPYSGLADVDVCAELQRTEEANARPTVSKDHSETHSTQLEDTAGHVSTQNASQTASLQEKQLREKVTQEGQEVQTKMNSGELQVFPSIEDASQHVHQMETILDVAIAPHEDALVEVNVGDVPEVQEIVEKVTQQAEEERPVVAQGELSERQSHSDSLEAESSHKVHGIQNNEECTDKIDRQEKEGDTKGGETGNHEVVDVVMEKVGTSDLNLSGVGGEENVGGVDHTILSGHPIADTENHDIKMNSDNHGETDNKEESDVGQLGNEDSETPKTHNDTEEPDPKEEEKTSDIDGQLLEDAQMKRVGETEERPPSEFEKGRAVTNTSASEPEKEAESVTVEVSPSVAPVESEERAQTPVEPEPEDTVEELEHGEKPQRTRADDQVEEVEVERKGQGESNAISDEGTERSHVSEDEWVDDDNQEDQRRQESGKDNIEAEGKNGDKQEQCGGPQEEEDIMDIPLDDPEANKAAAKIQAGFRGHMTRKKMKPEEKAEEEEEVSSSGEALNGSQGDTETGGAGAVEADATSVPEQ